jgi:protoporphyrinogen oxidase
LELEYRGVINAVFLLNRPLDGHYWAPVIDCDTQFDGVVEMSALTGVERFGGRSLVYAMHYCDRRSLTFAEQDEAIAVRWSRQLLTLYQDVLGNASAIDDVKVFRAPFVEPVHTVGYRKRLPDVEIAGTNVFLSTTAQIYPEVTSWNSSVSLANRVAARVMDRRSAVNHLVAVTDDQSA